MVQARFCPNCLPDYLNGWLLAPPKIEVQMYGYGAGKFRRCERRENDGRFSTCGMSYDIDPEERDHVWKTWLQYVKKHQNPDHLSDALAVYIADDGIEGIKKFIKLVQSWKNDYHLYDYGQHVISLSWIALTGNMANMDTILNWTGPLPPVPRVEPKHEQNPESDIDAEMKAQGYKYKIEYTNPHIGTKYAKTEAERDAIFNEFEGETFYYHRLNKEEELMKRLGPEMMGLFGFRESNPQQVVEDWRLPYESVKEQAQKFINAVASELKIPPPTVRLVYFPVNKYHADIRGMFWPIGYKGETGNWLGIALDYPFAGIEDIRRTARHETAEWLEYYLKPVVINRYDYIHSGDSIYLRLLRIVRRTYPDRPDVLVRLIRRMKQV